MEKMIQAMADVRLALKLGLSTKDILAILKIQDIGPATALLILNAAREP